MYKQMTALLLTATLLAVADPAAAQTQPPKLWDIGGAYAKQEIEILVTDGILTGYEDSTFRPNASMTRQEFAKVLAKAMKLEGDAAAAAKFTDVAPWARPYVGALVKAGLTQGVSATQFGAMQNITREQLAVFFIRGFGMEALANDLAMPSSFIDRGQVTGYAQNAVALAQKVGFLKGSASSTGYSFMPRGLSARQAVARLAYEFYNNRESYTGQFQTIRQAVDHLKQAEAVTNAAESYKLNMGMSMKMLDFSMHTDMINEVIVKPEYTMRITGTVTAPDGTGTLVSEPVESYVYKGYNFMRGGGGEWVSVELTAEENVGPSALSSVESVPTRYLAAYSTVAENEAENTVTITSKPSSSEYLSLLPPDLLEASGGEEAIFTNVIYTFVIDRTTHQFKQMHIVEDHGADAQTTIDVTFSDYNAVTDIIIPQEIKDLYAGISAK